MRKCDASSGMSSLRVRSGGRSRLMTERAVVEVFAEAAVFYCLSKINIGGSDDSHIDGDLAGSTDLHEAALLQRAQDLCLSLDGASCQSRPEESVPPLATSNRPRFAAMAEVKAPLTWPKSVDSSRSTGTAPVLMATNGLIAAGRGQVNSFRDQLFAGAAFAVDEHGGT